MTLTRQTDTTKAGLARLLEQYKTKPIITGFLAAYLDQLQGAEDLFFDLLAARLPADQDTSITGVHLDTLGKIVGQPRNGRNDTEYLKWIRARVLLNRSSGSPGSMLEITIAVYPEGTGILLVEGEEAEVQISITEAVDDAAELANILDKARPAGVRFNLLWYGSETGTFRFTTTGTTGKDTLQGFGDDTIVVGGQFAQAAIGS